MNRQKKFRVWDVEHAIMVPWKDAFYLPCKIASPDGKEISLPLINVALIAPKEKLVVMEYTGLKDKNEKPVYEGDIVELKEVLDEIDIDKLSRDEYIEYLKRSTETQKGTIKWDKELAGFMIETENGYISMSLIKEASVIGNIFESQEPASEE